MAVDTTLEHPRTTPWSGNGRPVLAEARRRRLRRSVPVAAVGLASLAASFVVFLAMEPVAPAARSVLVLSTPVKAGHLLTASDLRVGAVSAKGVSVLPASREANVVGQAASVDLPTGTLLVPADLATAAGPGPGQAVVGVALKAGQFPGEISPGAQVEVLSTTGSGPSSGPQLLAQAEVYGVHTDPSSPLTEVSLMLPEPESVAVTQAAAAGTVELVWVAP